MIMQLVQSTIVDYSRGYLHANSFPNVPAWPELIDRLAVDQQQWFQATSGHAPSIDAAGRIKPIVIIRYCHMRYPEGLHILDDDHVLLQVFAKRVVDGGCMMRQGMTRWVLASTYKSAWLDEELILRHAEETPSAMPRRSRIFTGSSSHPSPGAGNPPPAAQDPAGEAMRMLIEQLTLQQNSHAADRQQHAAATVTLVEAVSALRDASRYAPGATGGDQAQGATTEQLPHHKHPEFLQEGLIKLDFDMENIEEWRMGWTQWEVAMEESNKIGRASCRERV